MEVPVKITCPFGSACEEVKEGAIHRCAFWTELVGKNPQTGEDIKEHRCAITWLPLLLVENSRQQMQTGAAVESFRNEMIKANEMSQQVLLSAVNTQSRLIGS